MGSAGLGGLGDLAGFDVSAGLALGSQHICIMDFTTILQVWAAVRQW